MSGARAETLHYPGIKTPDLPKLGKQIQTGINTAIEVTRRRARIAKFSALRGYADAAVAIQYDSNLSQRRQAIEERIQIIQETRELAKERGGVRGKVAQIILFNSEPDLLKPFNESV